MIQLSLTALFDHLQKGNYAPQMIAESQQIYLSLTKEHLQLPLFLRLFEGGDLLQIMVFFPFTIPLARYEPLARLLHLFNKELDLPGFGLDEQSKVAYYRLMIPTSQNEVSEDLLDKMLNAVREICFVYVPMIIHASNSTEPLEKILNQLQEKVKL